MPRLDMTVDVQEMSTVGALYTMLQRQCEMCAHKLTAAASMSEGGIARAISFEELFVLLSRLHDMLSEGREGDCDCSITGLLRRWLRFTEEPSKLSIFPSIVVSEMGPSHPELWVALLRDRIDRDPSCELDVDASARTFRCTTLTLVRLFRRTTGVSISQYHKFSRVLEALRRLHTDNIKIEAIALSVGLSKKALYERFEPLAGMTPKEFRRLPEIRRSEVLANLESLRSDGSRLLQTLSASKWSNEVEGDADRIAPRNSLPLPRRA